MTPDERHRAPALWLVTSAIAASAGVAMWASAYEAILILVLTLTCAAVARVIGRGRRPEGVAVRATWVDALVLVALGVGIALLATTPGVSGDRDGQGRSVTSVAPVVSVVSGASAVSGTSAVPVVSGASAVPVASAVS